MDYSKVHQPVYAQHHDELPSHHSHFQLAHYCQLHLYHDTGCLYAGDEAYRLCQGSVSLIPPDVKSTYEREEMLSYEVVHFQWDALLPIPVLAWKVEQNYSEACEIFARLIGLIHAQPERARLQLLDLLLLISPPIHNDQKHPVVYETIQWMSGQIRSRITLREMAEEMGLSGVHLNRLFVEETGQSAVACFRSLQLGVVKHHLEYSQAPIKWVAAEVGFTDLHAFNKWVKRYLGDAPSILRKTKQASLI